LIDNINEANKVFKSIKCQKLRKLFSHTHTLAHTHTHTYRIMKYQFGKEFQKVCAYNINYKYFKI